MQDLSNNSREYIKSYIIEVKPRWWEFWKFLKPRFSDYTVATEDFTLVWLGGNKYSLQIKRQLVIYETNKGTDVPGYKVLDDDQNLDKK